MNYRLESFVDRACLRRAERLSLSASSDAQAMEQTRAVAWRHECAGESRVLVLSRPSDGGWEEMASMGTRRYA